MAAGAGSGISREAAPRERRPRRRLLESMLSGRRTSRRHAVDDGRKLTADTVEMRWKRALSRGAEPM
jgi:hypothetical protein